MCEAEKAWARKLENKGREEGLVQGIEQGLSQGAISKTKVYQINQ